MPCQIRIEVYLHELNNSLLDMGNHQQTRYFLLRYVIWELISYVSQPMRWLRLTI